MSPDRDDLEGRVSALEQEMRVVRQDAAAARVLAGGADRDVADLGKKLDAHTKVLNALRETQLEHGQRLDRHEERLDRLERITDEGFRELREGFAKMSIGFAEITRLIERVQRQD
jgi:hypothetical protein